ncbi:MAG TPA: CBS domain-containing protein [Candidatus Nanoarchaeia archaeon]|nr:CBS domain-containing protein [Candidatus Nanoarchaeia archaeon]
MQAQTCSLIKPLSCKKETSVVIVAKALKDNKQRRIIVVDENEHPVGIVSTTDINNKVVAENKDASKIKAEEIMTSPIYLVCDINEDVNEIFKKMVHHETFFVPITKEKKLYAVLTYGELLNCLKKE